MTESSHAAAPPIRRRVWAQDVAVNVCVLRSRLAVHRARLGADIPEAKRALVEGVELLLTQAEKAAYRTDPQPTRLGNWWRGTLIEAAYQNMHAAEAEMVGLYDAADIDAEVPEAIARVEAGLNRDDPRRRAVHNLPGATSQEHKRAGLRKAIETGYAAADRQHTRVRSFRNVVLVTAALLTFFVVVFCIVAGLRPEAVPLCFAPGAELACPAGGEGASALDVVVVSLLGALGGALAAAVSIRNLRGTSTPYDMPVALCLLKVPAGAMTALGALIAIRGEFVPGLSALDTQEQVLAYALVFGYAQQLLTRLIDDRASSVLDSIPSSDASVSRPQLDGWPETASPQVAPAPS